MLLKQLFEGDVDGYLRNAAVGDDLCVFVHIPKTAGSSLRTEIARLLQPDYNIEVDYTDTSRTFHERIDDAVETFLDEMAEKPVRFASGHILARHVVRIRRRFPTARFVTVLRNPVDRVISDYRYQRSPKHPVSEQFIRRFPDIESYLAEKPERNKMVRHLVPAEVIIDGEVEQCIAYIMKTYAFVGIQEMYPLSFRTLTSLVGEPRWPTVRENVGSGDVEPITAELQARIREANQLDSAIYDFFVKKMASLRERLAARLSEVKGAAD